MLEILVVKELLSLLLKRSVDALPKEDFLQVAVDHTDWDMFEQGLEGVGVALNAFCSAPEFQCSLEKIAAGEVGSVEEHLTANFLETSNAAYDDEQAQRILGTFFAHIQDQLVQTTQGAYMLRRLEKTLEKASAERQFLAAKMDTFRAELTSQIAGPPHDARLEDAKVLLEQGKAAAARTTLERLRQEIEDGSHPELTFRVATQLAVCAATLDEPDACRTETRIALELQPESEKARANASHGELSASRCGRAFMGAELHCGPIAQTQSPDGGPQHSSCESHGADRSDGEGLPRSGCGGAFHGLRLPFPRGRHDGGATAFQRDPAPVRDPWNSGRCEDSGCGGRGRWGRVLRQPNGDARARVSVV